MLCYSSFGGGGVLTEFGKVSAKGLADLPWLGWWAGEKEDMESLLFSSMPCNFCCYYRKLYQNFDMVEKRRCSGRDLNPGSATRKAAMLDRTVQPLGASTPPELQLEYFRNIIKSFLILLIFLSLRWSKCFFIGK